MWISLLAHISKPLTQTNDKGDLFPQNLSLCPSHSLILTRIFYKIQSRFVRLLEWSVLGVPTMIQLHKRPWLIQGNTRLIPKTIFKLYKIVKKHFCFWNVNVTVPWTFSTIRSKALLHSDSNVPRRSWPFTVLDRLHERLWAFSAVLWAFLIDCDLLRRR